MFGLNQDVKQKSLMRDALLITSVFTRERLFDFLCQENMKVAVLVKIH